VALPAAASTGPQVGLCPCQGLTSCPDQDSQGWHSMLPTTQPTSPPVRACRIWRLGPIRRPGDRLACLLTLPVSPTSTEPGPGLKLWASLQSLKKVREGFRGKGTFCTLRGLGLRDDHTFETPLFWVKGHEVKLALACICMSELACTRM